FIFSQYRSCNIAGCSRTHTERLNQVKHKFMKAYFALFFSMIICYASQAQTMKWNQNPVIAHRGAFKKNQYPENSIASLKEAIRLKCYGSEFDVHMTRDGIMVVNHDADFYGTDI